MQFLSVIGFFVIFAFSTNANSESRKNSLVKELENTHTRNLLNNIYYEYPTQEPRRKAKYLRKKLKEIKEKVNLSYLNSENKKEIAILEFLENKESNLQKDVSFPNRVKYLSSLSYPLDECSQMLTTEKAEIEEKLNDRRIRFSGSKIPAQTKSPKPFFFESTDEGRQKYLDLLANDLKKTGSLALSILENYPKSALTVVGERENDFSFYYRDRILRININNLATLPRDETIALAAFFGLPGAGAIREDGKISLSKFLYLPSYNLGWATYSLNELAELDPENSGAYLNFRKLIIVLGLTDLNMHIYRWSTYEGSKFLEENLNYSGNRTQLFLDQIRENSGFYLSVSLGGVFFKDVKRKCLEKRSSDFCGKELNQLIVDSGTTPLPYLKEFLISQFF
ncbi:MAG: DUF885 family protein [Candidatus Azotimanducaceae bacterium]